MKYKYRNRDSMMHGCVFDKQWHKFNVLTIGIIIHNGSNKDSTALQFEKVNFYFIFLHGHFKTWLNNIFSFWKLKLCRGYSCTHTPSGVFLVRAHADMNSTVWAATIGIVLFWWSETPSGHLLSWLRIEQHLNWEFVFLLRIIC